MPEEFRDLHDYIFYLHDIAVTLVKVGSDPKHSKLVIELKGEDDPGDDLEGEDMEKWLETNGYDNAVSSIILRNTYLALLTDFCHFVYEALTCSERGKLTVSFSLFRKPFKDNLLLLEWMLADPDSFLQKFRFGSSEDFAPDRISLDEKMKFIENAGVTANTQIELYDLIYNLRYSKSSSFGLERMWNKANHIVTTVKHYKTETGKLNFVFNGEEDLYDDWMKIYTVFPVLMHHSVEVIISLFGKLFPEIPIEDFIELEQDERLESLAGALVAIEELRKESVK